MPKSSPVTLPQAAVEHMSPVARGHLPEHLQGNFSVGADFPVGVTISYAYDFFAPPNGFHYEHDLIIGPGFVWGFPAPGDMSNVGHMDIHGNFLTIDFTQNASFGGAFNSFTLSDPYNQLPEITGVTLYNNGGSAALTQSDITFDANSVTVDLLGTSFTAGSMISLAFSFV